ncbi:MAG TPA: hypothetical protein VLF68_02805 [Candidatus Saccharimonadales bacterium]|nr:hypothetical protein [Candidatus Saccharimonadales bacterium]
MDDTAIQNSKFKIQNSGSDGDDQTQQTVTPISTPNKESVGGVSVDTSDLITPSEVEPQLHPEVQEAGVETVSDKPQLTDEHAKIGIKVSADATPVATSPTGMVQLPMTQAQAQATIKKTKNVKESIVWLASLILRQLKMSEKA